jgi:hypothetical protein
VGGLSQISGEAARELADVRRQALTPAQPNMNKADIVKLDVSSYNGKGTKLMALNRWFCEIDIVTGLRATHQLGATHKLYVTHTLSINQISVGGLTDNEYALD